MILPRARGLLRPRLAAYAALVFISAIVLIWTVSHNIEDHATDLQQPDLFSPQSLLEQHPSTTTNLSVNLVIASSAKDSTTWTSNVPIPDLKIIRYVGDDLTAPYHPPVANRGREALMYFTYMHDFYETLPDISIFIHPHEAPWHVDAALRQSMTFALSRLDLHQVVRKQYFNLRVGWKDACPDWINTTKTQDESWKSEEPFVWWAFRANFGEHIAVPEILAGPCCSQFAVTRDAITRRPKEQYRRSMDWLINVDWDDYITGRVWEHMWPYLFVEQATDCTAEHLSLCRMYGVCFANEAELSTYQKLWDERGKLREEDGFLRGLWDISAARESRGRIGEINRQLDEKLADAIARGKDQGVRGDLTREVPW